jgi:hypothetical protein
MHARRSNWPKIVGLAPADMARLPHSIITARTYILLLVLRFLWSRSRVWINLDSSCVELLRGRSKRA